MRARHTAGIALLGACGLAGCSGSGSYLPSETGLVWTYSIRTGFGAEHVEEMRVAGRQTVASAEGFVLSGPLGECRMAWKGGVLWAESFANASLRPAAPLFDTQRADRTWRGELVTAFGVEPARASLSHKSEKLALAGRPFDTVRTELAIDRPLGRTTLTTWFAPDVGIVRQEQRTRDALDLRLEWIAGPKRPSSRR